jgi:tripartite-type tricarboxylate transporter receptor subunit TctC
MPTTARSRWTAALAVLCIAPASASAQSVADFYNGKTVTIVVSTGTGGGYDALARGIARHIGRHIPGNPNVVVRNMPGAGGITAMNWLYNTADKDGTVLGLVGNGMPLEPLFGTKTARYDATKFNWLGTPSYEVSIVLLWHTVPVNSLEDLRTRETTMGSSGANSTPAFYARLLNATLETKMRVIHGYPGQNDALLAMERGELDGYPSVFYSALTSTRPTWLKEKKAKPIIQYGPTRLKELPGVPFVTDLLTNEDDRLMMQAASAGVGPALAAAAGRTGCSCRRHSQGGHRHVWRPPVPGRCEQNRADSECATDRPAAPGRDRARLCIADASGRPHPQAQ